MSRPIRISGNRNDVDFWRVHFTRLPLVCLDGQPVELVCEARSGSNGYVITEVLKDGKPVLADVVLDGIVIDQIIPKHCRHGHVTIEQLPEHLS